MLAQLIAECSDYDFKRKVGNKRSVTYFVLHPSHWTKEQ